MTTDRTITIRMRQLNGRPVIAAEGAALVFGIRADQIRPGVAFPRKWVKQGRRRSSEAKAHTGSSDLFRVMAYWAAKDHNAEIRFVYDEETS